MSNPPFSRTTPRRFLSTPDTQPAPHRAQRYQHRPSDEPSDPSDLRISDTESLQLSDDEAATNHERALARQKLVRRSLSHISITSAALQTPAPSSDRKNNNFQLSRFRAPVPPPDTPSNTPSTGSSTLVDGEDLPRDSKGKGREIIHEEVTLASEDSRSSSKRIRSGRAHLSSYIDSKLADRSPPRLSSSPRDLTTPSSTRSTPRQRTSRLSATVHQPSSTPLDVSSLASTSSPLPPRDSPSYHSARVHEVFNRLISGPNGALSQAAARKSRIEGEFRGSQTDYSKFLGDVGSVTVPGTVIRNHAKERRELEERRRKVEGLGQTPHPTGFSSSFAGAEESRDQYEYSSVTPSAPQRTTNLLSSLSNRRTEPTVVEEIVERSTAMSALGQSGIGNLMEESEPEEHGLEEGESLASKLSKSLRQIRESDRSGSTSTTPRQDYATLVRSPAEELVEEPSFRRSTKSSAEKKPRTRDYEGDHSSSSMSVSEDEAPVESEMASEEEEAIEETEEESDVLISPAPGQRSTVRFAMANSESDEDSPGSTFRRQRGLRDAAEMSREEEKEREEELESSRLNALLMLPPPSVNSSPVATLRPVANSPRRPASLPTSASRVRLPSASLFASASSSPIPFNSPPPLPSPPTPSPTRLLSKKISRPELKPFRIHPSPRPRSNSTPDQFDGPITSTPAPFNSRKGQSLNDIAPPHPLETPAFNRIRSKSMQLLRTDESNLLGGSDEVIQSIATDLLRAVKNLSSSPAASPSAAQRSTPPATRSASRSRRRETPTPDEVSLLNVDFELLLIWFNRFRVSGSRLRLR